MPGPGFDSRAEELFAEFLARGDGGEGGFDALCRGHPEHAEALRALNEVWGTLESLRRRVEDSLEQAREASSAQAGSTVEVGAAPGSAGSSGLLERLRAQSPRGTRYRILGEIARGGMGVVLRAFDDELRRPLAMKVALGEAAQRADPQLLSRFLEEAQVTGQLDHPGVVPVHELGLDSAGRVYFTMRLVKGEDLRAVFAHVKAGRGGWSQVRALGVLLKACEALSYAHDKGVVHRDLKPSNVMVGKFGEVYVMDWGLARVSSREDRHDLRPRPQASPPSAVLTDRHRERGQTPGSPLVTMDGTVVGTPCYMPPEQAQGRLEHLGPHSDVYSIGAMLYELVTGEMPYVPAGARVSRRTILLAVVQGPPRRLEELAPRTPPELAAIVEKAMRREIAARYASTAELAEDLRAYLEGRVVAAYETGAWAEARKWVRRNKPLAAAVAAALLAIVGGVVAFAVEAQRANRHAERARRSAGEASASAARAAQVTALVQAALVSSDPSQGGSQEYRVVEAMQAAMRELERGALAGDPQTEAALQATIGSILDGNGRPAEALLLAERALATRRRLFPGDHPDVAASLTDRANRLESLGRSAEALREYEAALAMQRRLVGGDHPALASGLNNVASCLQSLGHSAEALPMYHEALAMRERLFGGDHPDVATSLANLASGLAATGSDAEALPRYQAALEMRRRCLGEDHAQVAGSLNNLAYCLVRLGRSEEALPEYEAALALHRKLFHGDHPIVATSLGNLAFCLHSLGRSEEALEWDQAALEMRRRIFTGDHPDLAMSLGNKAARLYALGRSVEALPLFEEALAMTERLYEGDHPDVAVQLDNLARCLQSLGRAEEALPMSEAALEMAERVHRGDHPSLAVNLNNLASCLAALGRREEALQRYEAALGMRQRLFEGDHPEIATAWNNLAFCLGTLGRHEQALAAYEQMLAIAERLYPAGDSLVASALVHVADSLLDLGRAPQALPFAERARAMVARLPDTRYPRSVQVEALLERIRAALRD